MKKLTKQVPRRKLRSAEALAAWRLGHRVKASKTIYSRKGRAKVRPELFMGSAAGIEPIRGAV